MSERLGVFGGHRLADGTIAFYPQTSESNQLLIETYFLPVKLPVSDWYLATKHSKKHSGIDINLNKSPWGDVDLGLPVYATCNGLVVFAGQAKGHKWGNVVITAGSAYVSKPSSLWGSELLFWRYGHLKEVTAAVGQVARAGDFLGTIGKGYGDQFAAHLHLDCWMGSMIAPEAWLAREVEWRDPLKVWKQAGYDWWS
jgi:murein DD-endopeptidase MepM/ murein hydrolase activator NlpD